MFPYTKYSLIDTMSLGLKIIIRKKKENNDWEMMVYFPLTNLPVKQLSTKYA